MMSNLLEVYSQSCLCLWCKRRVSPTWSNGHTHLLASCPRACSWCAWLQTHHHRNLSSIFCTGISHCGYILYCLSSTAPSILGALGLTKGLMEVKVPKRLVIQRITHIVTQKCQLGNLTSHMGVVWCIGMISKISISRLLPWPHHKTNTQKHATYTWPSGLTLKYLGIEFQILGPTQRYIFELARDLSTLWKLPRVPSALCL